MFQAATCDKPIVLVANFDRISKINLLPSASVSCNTQPSSQFCTFLWSHCLPQFPQRRKDEDSIRINAIGKSPSSGPPPLPGSSTPTCSLNCTPSTLLILLQSSAPAAYDRVPGTSSAAFTGSSATGDIATSAAAPPKCTPAATTAAAAAAVTVAAAATPPCTGLLCG